MIFLKRIIAFIFVVPFLFISARALSVSAHSAILYDPLTETALFEKAADERRAMASTTKIMTALLALEHGDLSNQVLIKKEYTLVEGSSMYLKAGETVSLNCLLHGLLLLSGNDAAKAIAGYLAGSDQAFSKLMNEKAHALSLTNTNFENPSGLDGKNHYTTAKDLARLAAYAINLPGFCEITSKKQYSEGAHSMRNHNRLLWEYDGADGVKTGFTKKSGRCLVSSTERNGRRLIVATLNAPSDWRDHKTLLDYGFSLFTDTVLAKENVPVFTVPVVNGISDGVAVFCPEEITFFLNEVETALVHREFYGPRFVYAPVKRGALFGTMRLTINGYTLKETPVYYLDSVPLKEEIKRHGLFSKIANLFGF